MIISRCSPGVAHYGRPNVVALADAQNKWLFDLASPALMWHLQLIRQVAHFDSLTSQAKLNSRQSPRVTQHGRPIFVARADKTMAVWSVAPNTCAASVTLTNLCTFLRHSFFNSLFTGILEIYGNYRSFTLVQHPRSWIYKSFTKSVESAKRLYLQAHAFHITYYKKKQKRIYLFSNKSPKQQKVSARHRTCTVTDTLS